MSIRNRITQFKTYLVAQFRATKGGVLFGRVTGAGAGQEITVGSGLTLTGTTLTGTTLTADAGDGSSFATAGQGAKADSASQPGHGHTISDVSDADAWVASRQGAVLRPLLQGPPNYVEAGGTLANQTIRFGTTSNISWSGGGSSAFSNENYVYIGRHEWRVSTTERIYFEDGYWYLTQYSSLWGKMAILRAIGEISDDPSTLSYAHAPGSQGSGGTFTLAPISGEFSGIAATTATHSSQWCYFETSVAGIYDWYQWNGSTWVFVRTDGVTIPASQTASLGSSAITLNLSMSAGIYNRLTSVDDITLTIPTDASVAIPVDSEFVFRRSDSAGLVAIALQSGVTMEGDASLIPVNGMFVLKKTGTDSWDFI